MLVSFDDLFPTVGWALLSITISKFLIVGVLGRSCTSSRCLSFSYVHKYFLHDAAPSQTSLRFCSSPIRTIFLKAFSRKYVEVKMRSLVFVVAFAASIVSSYPTE